MTIWHVQKIYISDSISYNVIPYDFWETTKNTLKMKNGICQMMKLLSDSRLTEQEADLLCEKKRVECSIYKE